MSRTRYHSLPSLVRRGSGYGPWNAGTTARRATALSRHPHQQQAAEAERTHYPAPSYATVRRIVAALDPAMVTLALEGPASDRDRRELVLRRRADRPNAIWQADHTQLDILTIGAHTAKPDRPWLTVILDDYSRAICGYTVFLGAPSAMITALALRQAIWRKPDPSWVMCGIPDILHVDHGSDFTSHHLGEYPSSDLLNHQELAQARLG